MKILKSDLQSAAEKEIITPNQADNLWHHLLSLRPDQPKFQALHVLYYFGGILILSSMSWFLTKAWNDGAMIMFITGVFSAAYLFAGNKLWDREGLKIPAGLLITAAVGLAPVFIYGFQLEFGLWPQGPQNLYSDYHRIIRGSWIFMEIGTVVVALIALRFYKFSFIAFPLALTLWYMSMDITPLLLDKSKFSYEERKIVSCIFGALILISSYFVDRKFKKVDFAFWTYLFGLMSFWGAFSVMNSGNEIGKFIYCLVNIGFIFLSVYLRRKVFIVFGVLGVLGYLSHLAWAVFKDSQIFPIVLALLGILIVFLGVKYQRNREKFESVVEDSLPNFLNKWRPEERV